MIINVNDEYRIRTDPYQYILEHRPPENPDKPRKSDGWRPVAYIKNLGELFGVLMHRQIHAADVEVPSDGAEAALKAIIAHTEACRAEWQRVVARITERQESPTPPLQRH